MVISYEENEMLDEIMASEHPGELINSLIDRASFNADMFAEIMYNLGRLSAAVIKHHNRQINSKNNAMSTMMSVLASTKKNFKIHNNVEFVGGLYMLKEARPDGVKSGASVGETAYYKAMQNYAHTHREAWSDDDYIMNVLLNGFDEL